MKLSVLAKQELQRLRAEDLETYSALHNHERARWRSDLRWRSHARGEPPDVEAPPGAGPDDLAMREEAEQRTARFEKENEELIRRYKETPPERKRERRELGRELLRRLLASGLITGQQFVGLCAVGPRARKWWGTTVQVARATA